MNDTVIHLFHEGFPVCGFSSEAPANWPEGHKWVSIQWSPSVTCPSCKEWAQALASKEPARVPR